MRMSGASSLAILYMSSAMESPRKGNTPVSIWNSMTPSEYRSERPSTFLPAICSGDMKLGVPSTRPVLVLLESVMRAMPKSVTFTVSLSTSYMMFAGLMSRWTTFCRCA